MFPGMDPRAVKSAMKKMGMKQDDVSAKEVIIRTSSEEIVINPASVQKIEMMGQVSYQVSGIEQVRSISTITEEDIQTVVEQTSVSSDEAKKAIEQAGGDLAQAIMNLKK